MMRAQISRSSLATLLLAGALSVIPCTGFAQTPQAASELARARSLLERSRAELTAQQYALLSSRLAETEAASVELTNITGAAGEAATVAAEGGAAGAVATGGRALLGGLAELLPVLIAVWPATAHAPGNKEEKPEVRAARVKLEERARALAQAAQQVEAEQKAVPSGASNGFTDDMDCVLDGSGGGGTPKSPWTCRYHCAEALITVVLPTRDSRCPGEETRKVKWKDIKGFPRKP
jgi:hypothetical protein